MYTFVTEDSHESKKARYINKKVVDDEQKYGKYKNVLFNLSYMGYKMNRIQSKDHNIGSNKINKFALSSYDDIN